VLNLFYYALGDSLGLTPADNKELAVHALGGCVCLLKEFLLEQQLLAQGCFNTYIPPDFSAANSRTGLNYANTMVIDAVTIKNLRLFGEGSLINVLDHCCTAFGKRYIFHFVLLIFSYILSQGYVFLDCCANGFADHLVVKSLL